MTGFLKLSLHPFSMFVCEVSCYNFVVVVVLAKVRIEAFK